MLLLSMPWKGALHGRRKQPQPSPLANAGHSRRRVLRNDAPAASAWCAGTMFRFACDGFHTTSLLPRQLQSSRRFFVSMRSFRRVELMPAAMRKGPLVVGLAQGGTIWEKGAPARHRAPSHTAIDKVGRDFASLVAGPCPDRTSCQRRKRLVLLSKGNGSRAGGQLQGGDRVSNSTGPARVEDVGSFRHDGDAFAKVAFLSSAGIRGKQLRDDGSG